MLKKMWHLCGDFKWQIMVTFVFQRKSGVSSVLLTIRLSFHMQFCSFERQGPRELYEESDVLALAPQVLGPICCLGEVQERPEYDSCTEPFGERWRSRFHRGEMTGWRDDGFVFRCVVIETLALLFRIGFPLDCIFLKYFLHLWSLSPSL